MNSHEAKLILTLYRPGVTADDPEFAEARTQVERDPELRHWFEHHCAFQTALRDKFRELPVPPDLPSRLLASKKIIRPTVWWRPAWAAVAALLIAVGLAVWWFREPVPDQFNDYRARMVRSALRQYRTDIETNDLSAVLQFLAAQGAPVDFVIPPPMERLALTGGGRLRWRGHSVSMVCYDRGNKHMVFLFVVDRHAVKKPPAAKPEIAQVGQWTTASWTQGNHSYLMTGADPTLPVPQLP